MFAKEIGAIFRYTSAKNASGIDELFKAIGSKLLDPNYEEGGKVEVDEEHVKVRSQTINMNSKGTNKKKGCC
jgi:membrane-bound ClpP family serine protease